jgi:hypothetical protein
MPYVFSRGSYTTVTLLGTLSFALSYFLGALLLTQVFTLRLAEVTHLDTSRRELKVFVKVIHTAVMLTFCILFTQLCE